MAVPSLEEILNLEAIGPATLNILASLPEVEKQRLAATITRTIETAVDEAIVSPASNEDLQEFWWIFSPSEEEWGGLRLAAFRKASTGPIFFLIANELPQRTGLRDWESVSEREGWRKVMRVPMPTQEDIASAS
jgi:hypothetical protein